MTDLKLVIFDVDGTLVDSQGLIVVSMTAAFEQIGMAAPSRDAIKSIVGLSLEEGMAVLVPEAGASEHVRLAEAYRRAYFEQREARGSAATSPFYEGAREVLDQLRADDWTLLAIATGKSKRGVDKLIEGHGLEGYFASAQCSDFHPSKPHPSMIQTALSETGVDAVNAVMVGDTTFDMDMAKAAGVKAIGVSWGYHDAATLNADVLIDSFAELPAAIQNLLGD